MVIFLHSISKHHSPKLNFEITGLTPVFPPNNIILGLLKTNVFPYLFPGVYPSTFKMLHFSDTIFKTNKSSLQSPPPPEAAPKYKPIKTSINYHILIIDGRSIMSCSL